MQDGCSQASADADSTAAHPGVSIAASGHVLRTRLRDQIYAAALLRKLLMAGNPCCIWFLALLTDQPAGTQHLDAGVSIMMCMMNMHV